MAQPRNSGKLRTTSIQTNIFFSPFISKKCCKSRDSFSLSFSLIAILQLKLEIIQHSLFEIKTKAVQPSATFHGLQTTHTFVVWFLFFFAAKHYKMCLVNNTRGKTFFLTTYQSPLHLQLFRWIKVIFETECEAWRPQGKWAKLWSQRSKIKSWPSTLCCFLNWERHVTVKVPLYTQAYI